MSSAICSFCGQEVKGDGHNYMQVSEFKANATLFQFIISLENLFMCHDCFGRLLQNTAHNAENFRLED